MNQWAFVAAAYAVTIATAIGLSGWAYMAMRRAERRADALTRRG